MFIFKKIFNYDKKNTTKENKDNKKIEDNKKDDYTADPFFFT